MSGTPASDLERVNILLVDDRPGNLLSLGGVLERPDYNLVRADSGPAALRAVLQQDFAVILLDVAMPGMDGFEVAKLLKQRERYKHVPIIFVTASVQHIEWIFKAYSIGAVDFLHKPVDPDAVRAKVSVFVELFRQRRQIERQVEQLRDGERQKRELAIARVQLESERRYRTLADAIPHVVWTADGGGGFASFNRRWTETTGLPARESLGRRWLGAVHPDERESVEKHWSEALASERELDLAFRLRQTDGSFRWVDWHALPERDAAGRIARWLGTFTDIDDRKRAHDEMQAAVEMRDEFLSVASHELRTPLTALNLHLESLQRLLVTHPELAPDERVRKRVENAVRQTQRLANLVEQLLDVTRIHAGRLELHLEDFDLAASVRDVVERFREESVRVGCEVRVDVPESLHCTWDRVRIEQVLTNLVSNALKYAPGKPVDVTAREEGGYAVLSVLDRGIGIDEAKLSRIFERFERAVTGRHYSGLGLGLYIVRQIVEAHGGHVEVTTKPGQGARFDVVLPVRAEVARAPEEENTPRGLPAHGGGPQPRAREGSAAAGQGARE